MQYIASAHSFMQGNVGIGTTSQGALLETSRPHDSGFGLRLSVTGINDVNQASAMDFYDVSNASEMAKIQAITEVSFGCNLQFWTKTPSGECRRCNREDANHGGGQRPALGRRIPLPSFR